MKELKSILAGYQGELNSRIAYSVKQINRTTAVDQVRGIYHDIQIVLGKDIDGEVDFIIGFKNVRFKKFDLAILQLGGCSVEAVEERGMENINFHFYSYDDNDIDFYFEEYFVTSLNENQA